jgi:hypothetical protein
VVGVHFPSSPRIRPDRRRLHEPLDGAGRRGL